MLSREDNQLVTQVGPGTPAGDLFRRYWIPMVQSDELAADGPPVRVEILGEELVVFRDTNGRVGVLEEHCPHRGAALGLGRNEQCGLRCLYHGWKFDVEGNCLDMPTEPADSEYVNKVKAKNYPSHEAGGVVWGLMGEPGEAPPFPNFLWATLPPSQRKAMRVREECNYLQAIEGGIDSAHLGYLHLSFGDKTDGWGIHRGDSQVVGGRPEIHVQPTRYGFRCAAIRRPTEADQHIRVTPFIFPWYTYVPELIGGRFMLFHAWVPRNDTTTWAWDIHFDPDQPFPQDESADIRGVDLDEEFSKPGNRDNDWLQDRSAMSTTNFSGIRGIMNQDHAVQESMGPVYDRSREHLGTSDRAVIALRRLLLEAIRGLPDGKAPPGLAADLAYERITSSAGDAPAANSWVDVFPLDPLFAASGYV
jgi:phthalate 4,5-dioxygenase oxygenase subunit